MTDDHGQRHYDVRRRRFSPTLLNAASMLHAAIAINAGIGLIGTEDNGTLGSRQAGYTAALPDELDPRVADNAIGEVAWFGKSRFVIADRGVPCSIAWVKLLVVVGGDDGQRFSSVVTLCPFMCCWNEIGGWSSCRSFALPVHGDVLLCLH